LTPIKERQMANNPIPDHVTEMMNYDFGTKYLITDPKSDKYLNMYRKKPNNPPENRLSKWCGGEDGFDDYVEWM
jgi:hypothetical protein